jgi:hypothetical protein
VRSCDRVSAVLTLRVLLSAQNASKKADAGEDDAEDEE